MPLIWARREFLTFVRSNICDVTTDFVAPVSEELWSISSISDLSRLINMSSIA